MGHVIVYRGLNGLFSNVLSNSRRGGKEFYKKNILPSLS